MPKRLYIAVDGVLNSEAFLLGRGIDTSRLWSRGHDIDARAISRLNNVVPDQHGGGMVLLPSWRYSSWPLRRVQDTFANMGVGLNIETFLSGDKEEAIETDLQRLPPSIGAFTPVIVDTTLNPYNRLKNYVVLINKVWGLQEKDVDTINRRFS